MLNRWSDNAHQLADTQTVNCLTPRVRVPLGPAAFPAAAAMEFLRFMRVTFDAVSSAGAVAAPSSDDFFRQLCSSAGVAIVATGENLQVRFWNATAQELFGGDQLGGHVLDLLPPESRGEALRALQRTLQEGEISEIEFEHRTATDGLMNLAATISPVLDETGRTRGVSLHVRNVTRRIALQREMADTQAMSALGMLAGAVAHHFNNVLGGIITSIDFAESSDNPATLRRVLQTTVAALCRANQLTLGLLAFAEGDSTDPASAEAYQTVGEFASELQAHLGGRKIMLETNLQPVPALMPVKRLRTILDNLTSNACEAMPEGGHLKLELLPEGVDHFVLRVSDTGSGIPAEVAAHAFEPFFTTKASRSDHVGLGLAVVHGIVRQLGGTVRIESQPSGGTTCVVHLPTLPAKHP